MKEVDKSNPYQLYCWEFQQSLLEYTNGNWFGRLMAYKGVVKIEADSFKQEEFQSSIENGSLKIISMETDFPNVKFTKDNAANSADYQSGTITSQVEGEFEVNGQVMKGSFTITHQVKPAFQTKTTDINM